MQITFANKADFGDLDAKAVKWIEDGIAEQISWLENKVRYVAVERTKKASDVAARVDINVFFDDMGTVIRRDTDESYQLRWEVAMQ